MERSCSQLFIGSTFFFNLFGYSKRFFSFHFLGQPVSFET